MENELHSNEETTFSSTATSPSMNLTSRYDLIQTLQVGPDVRSRFVESQLSKGLAFQLRSLRDLRDWTQEELAAKVGMPQNAISRLENPYYGKPTLTTLKRLAAIYDVALIVRFVPFGELINYVSGTPYQEKGLRPEAMDIPSFTQEFEPANVPLDRIPPQPARRIFEDLGSAKPQGEGTPQLAS